MKRLINRIKNILRWLPVIWKDRDFDFEFLLDILSFKLLNMYKFFSNDKLTVCADSAEIEGEIKEVLDAITRYRNNDYCKEWYNLLYQKHGDICGATNPFRLHFPQSNDNDKAVKIWRMLNKRSDDLQQQDFEFVFDTLKNKLQNWWD
jgi:hypothetical protein